MSKRSERKENRTIRMTGKKFLMKALYPILVISTIADNKFTIMVAFHVHAFGGSKRLCDGFKGFESCAEYTFQEQASSTPI